MGWGWGMCDEAWAWEWACVGGLGGCWRRLAQALALFFAGWLLHYRCYV